MDQVELAIFKSHFVYNLNLWIIDVVIERLSNIFLLL